MINHQVNELFPCYAKDNRGFYIFANQDFLNASLFTSAKEVLGYTDEALPWGDNAAVLMSNDMRVMKAEQTHIYMEHCVYKGKPHIFRSTKSPFVGHNGKILGVNCVSIPVSDLCLIPLTKQQTACLKHLALGMTHKHIAQTLGLAQKTVEHYLDAIKLKLNLKTRAELIMHAIERGLVGIF